MTQTQALTKAIYLAICAPDDYKAMQATQLAIELTKCLNNAQVEQCKLDALEMIGENP